jgi:hypothetical protein
LECASPLALSDGTANDAKYANGFTTGFNARAQSISGVLRLTKSQSGLALEQKLAPADAVARQKEKLLSAFQAALARVELSAASSNPSRGFRPS